ncbi:MAG: chemotaxis protein CheB [Chloroflexi bacterium]|nr:chemotaxis protein CheB [Chloroflexota bacterium]
MPTITRKLAGSALSATTLPRVTGLSALEILLRGLPSTFPLPLVIVQHRSAGATANDWLRTVLQRHTSLKLLEPQDKETLQPERVYLAPPDYHLMVEDGAFALSTEAPVCSARPSIDVLFESVADAFGERAVAVVLTGSSADGARGAARVKREGGLVIVQDPATAESPVMPQAALAACQVDATLPLPKIAPYLIGLVSS